MGIPTAVAKLKPRCVSVFLLKTWPYPASFCLFSFFSHDKYSTNLIIIESVDGALGI